MIRSRLSCPRFGVAWALACSLVAGAPASADPDLFARRIGMLGVDEACGLLSEGARDALASGAAAARSTLLYEGFSAEAVDAIARTAKERGARRSCDDPGLAALITDAESAYTAWRTLITLDYPGLARSWRAYRLRLGVPPVWLARQDTPIGLDGRAAFGLTSLPLEPVSPDAGSDPATAPAPIRLKARVGFVLDQPGVKARSARLFVRNRDKAHSPVDPFVSRLAGLDPSDPLLLKAAPPELARAYWAGERLTGAPADPYLLGGVNDGALFLFGPEALEAVLALDPRESVFVEVDVIGAPPLRIAFEIGDLAAAHLFATLP